MIFDIFNPKEHYITKVGDKYSNKVLLKTQRQLDNLLAKQKSNEDIYITKYPKNKKIKNIILDFDSWSKRKAWNDVVKLYNYLKIKNINSFIVDSTNKGYHIYIQISPTDFSFFNKQIFNIFIKELIHYQYSTLDMINTNAGLGGNIRLIGSIHPKTDKKLQIVKGNPILKEDLKTYYNKVKPFIDDLLKESLYFFKLKEQEKVKKVEYKKADNDIISSNDLRKIFPSIFTGKYKRFNDYIFMQCPFHFDESPSLLITKDFYSCASCGEKGNIWTLIKKGYIKYNDVIKS